MPSIIMFMRIALVLLFLLLVGIGVAAVFLHNYLQSPEFSEQVLARTSQAVGSQVHAEGIEISLFRGITLQGVRVANPQGLPGDFLNASAMVLQYRLLPLISRRVEIDRLTLENPALQLFQTQEDGWNFQLFRRPWAAGTPTPVPTPVPTKDTGLDILLTLFRINQGEVILRDQEGALLVDIRGLDLTASANLARKSKLTADGSLRLTTLQLGDQFQVNGLSAKLAVETGQVRLQALAGEMAEGQLSGNVSIQIQPSFGYRLDLTLADAAVEQLSRHEQNDPPLTGILTVRAEMKGTAGLDTMDGSGSFQITDGVVSRFPSQETAADLLRIPELRKIQFSICSGDFTLQDNRLLTNDLQLISPLLRLTGQGTVSLAEGSIDHEMILWLGEQIMDRLPSPIRRGFSAPDAEGFHATPFRVWGPYDQPQTDLQERLAESALDGLLNDGLEGLKGLFR